MSSQTSNFVSESLIESSKLNKTKHWLLGTQLYPSLKAVEQAATSIPSIGTEMVVVEFHSGMGGIQ